MKSTNVNYLRVIYDPYYTHVCVRTQLFITKNRNEKEEMYAFDTCKGRAIYRRRS
jgi:hypothetical protein